MGTAARPDRRIAKTRAAINKAFLELFAEKPFEHITINDISERANVNRGTVYLHYSDKYDLLDKCIEEHLNKLLDFCNPSGAGRPSAELVRDLEPVFVYFADNFPFFSALLSHTRSSVFRERLLQYVSDSLKSKTGMSPLRPEIDRELHAQFMSSAFVGIVEWWIRGNMPHPPRYMAEQSKRLFETNDVYAERP